MNRNYLGNLNQIQVATTNVMEYPTCENPGETGCPGFVTDDFDCSLEIFHKALYACETESSYSEEVKRLAAVCLPLTTSSLTFQNGRTIGLTESEQYLLTAIQDGTYVPQFLIEDEIAFCEMIEKFTIVQGPGLEENRTV